MNYYAPDKLKLLKDFDNTAQLMQDYLVNRYGEKFALCLYKETKLEYEKLIPQIPCIKDIRARALNSFLIITAQELAVYRTMKNHGKELDETWEICHEAIRRKMEKFSKFKSWLLKKLMFSNFLAKRVKNAQRKISN